MHDRNSLLIRLAAVALAAATLTGATITGGTPEAASIQQQHPAFSTPPPAPMPIRAAPLFPRPVTTAPRIRHTETPRLVKRTRPPASHSRSYKRPPLPTPAVRPGSARAIAHFMMSAGQFMCFSNIVDHESGWSVTATNPSSGAYGLMQALPGSKMASVASDWRTNPRTQITWGLRYMNSRYGSPCGAWGFWVAHRWY